MFFASSGRRKSVNSCADRSTSRSRQAQKASGSAAAAVAERSGFAPSAERSCAPRRGKLQSRGDWDTTDVRTVPVAPVQVRDVLVRQRVSLGLVQIKKCAGLIVRTGRRVISPLGAVPSTWLRDQGDAHASRSRVRFMPSEGFQPPSWRTARAALDRVGNASLHQYSGREIRRSAGRSLLGCVCAKSLMKPEAMTIFWIRRGVSLSRASVTPRRTDNR